MSPAALSGPPTSKAGNSTSRPYLRKMPTSTPIQGIDWPVARSAMVMRETSQHLARVEDAVGIERVLERAHQVERDRVFHVRKEIAFEPADAMLGRDRSVERGHDLVHARIDCTPLRQKRRLVGTNGLADVEMHVAVAEMAERHGAAAGDELLDRRARPLDELRHHGDRYRDVVLDRSALRALRLADQVAQMPERLRLLDAGRDRGVGDEAALGRSGEKILQARAQAVARRRGQLDQHVPGMRRSERIARTRTVTQ